MDRIGLVLLLATAIGWSLSGVIIKVVDMEALPIAFYRSAVAAVFLSFTLRKKRKTIRVDMAFIAAAYASAVILLVVSTKATTAANAIILQYTAPAFVFFIAMPLLREYPSRRDWWVLLSTMVGIGCIFSQAEEAHLWGILCGVGSGLGFAVLTVLLRRYQHEPLWSIAVNNFCVALMLLPWVYEDLWLTPRDFALMVLMGTVQLGGPYVLFAYALRRVTARDAALVSLLEPLLNPIWVYLWVAEVPAPMTFVGGAFILAGIFARFVPTGKPVASPP
jgi:drug/metabolite transporter (DMT)-like permease